MPCPSRRPRPLTAVCVLLLTGVVAGCGSDPGAERHHGVSRDEAEAVARRLECPGEEARRIACEPARAGWRCQYGKDRQVVTVTEPHPETGTLC